MKKMFSTIAVFAIGFSYSQTLTLLADSFDDDSKLSKSHTFFNDATGDYFGIYDPLGATDDYDGGANSVASFASFTGYTGNYLVGEDLDGGGEESDVISLTWLGIDITSKDNLSFSVDLAASPLRWDPGDKILIETQIDGGGYVTLIEFLHDELNGPTASSNNLSDGIVGVGGRTVLTNAFQTISKSISGTGTTLDVKITFRANAGSEEFGVDNLLIKGDDETLSTELLENSNRNIRVKGGGFVSSNTFLKIQVYNTLGKKVSNESLSPGIYILKVTDENGDTVTLKRGI